MNHRSRKQYSLCFSLQIGLGYQHLAVKECWWLEVGKKPHIFEHDKHINVHRIFIVDLKAGCGIAVQYCGLNLYLQKISKQLNYYMETVKSVEDIAVLYSIWKRQSLLGPQGGLKAKLLPEIMHAAFLSANFAVASHCFQGRTQELLIWGLQV